MPCWPRSNKPLQLPSAQTQNAAGRQSIIFPDRAGNLEEKVRIASRKILLSGKIFRDAMREVDNTLKRVRCLARFLTKLVLILSTWRRS